MKHTIARRLAVVAAAGLVMTVAPAFAATGNLDYPCDISVLGSSQGSTTFTIDADSNAPATMSTGATFTPTLTSTVTMPSAFVDGLRAHFTSMSGNVVSNIKINGVAKQVTQTFASQNFPASGAMTVSAKGPFPQLAPTTAGSITYLPGNDVVTMNWSGSLSATGTATCTMPANNTQIDQVSVTGSTITKRKSTTVVTASYKRATRKLTAHVVVSASGLTPTGTVKIALYKAGHFVRSVTKTLSSGKASTVFTKVRHPGHYTVTATYSGSSRVFSSKGSKSITLH